MAKYKRSDGYKSYGQRNRPNYHRPHRSHHREYGSDKGGFNVLGWLLIGALIFIIPLLFSGN